MKSAIRIFATLLLVAIFAACSTSPRGRKVIKLMPDSQMDAMGIQAFSDMKQSTPIERSASINNYVKCVTTPLTALVDSASPEGGWEVVVFKDDTANAFALPGGKIGVHTGILKVAETPAQLAAVIGHEIGHVLAEHSNERVSENVVAQLGLAGVGLAMSEKNKNYGLVMGALGLGAQFGYLLPHSRDQESEADIMGLELMAKAGFDPNQAVTLWENMSKSGGAGVPEFMSTHPAPATRIQNIQRHAPEFMGYYKAATPTHCSR